MMRSRWAWTGGSVLALVLMMGVGLAMPTMGAGGATLPKCPVISSLPVKPVASDVRAVLTKYYSAKHLTPISVYKNQETILNVKNQSVGTHWCKNPDGSKSGYVGMVPKNATAAVMVHVKHKPYPVTEAPSSFVTLAKVPGVGWKVVSEGTGP